MNIIVAFKEKSEPEVGQAYILGIFIYQKGDLP